MTQHRCRRETTDTNAQEVICSFCTFFAVDTIYNLHSFHGYHKRSKVVRSIISLVQILLKHYPVHFPATHVALLY